MRAILILSAVFLVSGSVGHASEAPSTAKATPETATEELSPDQQVALLEAQCAESEEARTARHTEEALYLRLGKEEGITALIRESLRLHLENEAIKHFFVDLDLDELAKRSAPFLVAGTGGAPDAYDGPDLTTSHAHLKLTNADFLAAGADLIQAMKNLEYGQNEIDEIVCGLVGLRDQVVLTAGEEVGSGGEIQD